MQVCRRSSFFFANFANLERRRPCRPRDEAGRKVDAAAAATPAPKLDFWTGLRAAWAVRSAPPGQSAFECFMANLRESKGDVLNLDLRPVLPPTYILMGKAANYVCSNSELEQIFSNFYFF